jgi:hypothetical protein
MFLYKMSMFRKLTWCGQQQKLKVRCMSWMWSGYATQCVVSGQDTFWSGWSSEQTKCAFLGYGKCKHVYRVSALCNQDHIVKSWANQTFLSDQTVNCKQYLSMLHNSCMLQLVAVKCTVVIQDGAKSHYLVLPLWHLWPYNHVWYLVDIVIAVRVCGRIWLSSCPDFNICYFFLLGFMK